MNKSSSDVPNAPCDNRSERNEQNERKERKGASGSEPKQESEQVFHIRKRLQPQNASTFCGEAVTEHDVNWNVKPVDWTKHSHEGETLDLVYCRKCYKLSKRDSLQHYAEAKKTSKNKVKKMQKQQTESEVATVTQQPPVTCAACDEDAQIHESIIHSGKLYHRRCLEENPNLPTSATMPLLPPLSNTADASPPPNAKQVEIKFPVDTLLQITKLLPKTQTQDRTKIASALAKHGAVLGQCKQCKGAFLAEEMIRVENCQSNASIRALMVLLDPKTPAQTRKRQFQKNAKPQTPVPVFLFCSTDCDQTFDANVRDSIKTIREAMAAAPQPTLAPDGSKVRRGSWRDAPSRPADADAEAAAISATRSQTRLQKHESYTKRTRTTSTTTVTVVEEEVATRATQVAQATKVEPKTHAEARKTRRMYEKNLKFEIAHKTYTVQDVEAALTELKPRDVVKIKIQHPHSSLTYRTFGRWQHDEGYGSLDEIIMFIIGSTGNFLKTNKVG